MSGMASTVYEEFVDYQMGNTQLHRDNDQIFARIDALAQTKELQVQKEESNTQYLASLMAYYHNRCNDPYQIIQVFKTFDQV